MAEGGSRARLAVSGLVVTGILLAGCTGLTRPSPDPAPPIPTPTSTAGRADSAATTVPPYPRIPTDTVVARGTLTAPDGTPVGAVRLTAFVDTDFTLTITGLAVPGTGVVQLAFAKRSLAAGARCAPDPAGLAIGATSSRAATQTFDVPLPDALTAGDPTNLTDLTVTGQPSGSCARPVLARASLAWTWPKARYTAGTLRVVDRGPRDGARGRSITEAGAPIRYVVADGDRQSAVLARFGIDLDQLQYLNPGSFRDQQSAVPLAGFTWNLDLADR